MSEHRPTAHTDLRHWQTAVRTEVDDLLQAVQGRPTVDFEAARAARGHFEQGFRLVDQALRTSSPSP